MRRPRTIILLGAVLSIVACDEMPEDAEYRAGGRYEGTDPWILNGLTGNEFIEAQSLNENQSLSSQTNTFSSNLMSYVVACALDEGTSLAGHAGFLGLAPEWRNGSCDTNCQEWMTACLGASLNETGGVEVHLKGDAFNPDTSGPDGITGEAAFYGNIFKSFPEAFYCQLDGNWSDTWVDDRSCSDVGPTCPIVGTQVCGNWMNQCQSSGGDAPYQETCKRPGPGGVWYPTISVYSSSGGSGGGGGGGGWGGGGWGFR